jgi:hypothetical protein
MDEESLSYQAESESLDDCTCYKLASKKKQVMKFIITSLTHEAGTTSDSPMAQDTSACTRSELQPFAHAQHLN